MYLRFDKANILFHKLEKNLLAGKKSSSQLQDTGFRKSKCQEIRFNFDSFYITVLIFVPYKKNSLHAVGKESVNASKQKKNTHLFFGKISSFDFLGKRICSSLKF